MRAEQTSIDKRRTSPALAALKPTARSKLTNGSQLTLTYTDGRSIIARRFRDLCAELTTEFPTADLVTVRTLATVVVQSELLQAQVIRGEAADADTLIRLSSEARRIRRALANRKPDAPGPTLDEYLASIERRADNYDEEADG